MENATQEPGGVDKNPAVIKDAQADIARIDILVCGNCHMVYHFVEEFLEHQKPGQCTAVSNLRDNNEPKAQVWAFLLWKNNQMKTNEADNDNSWIMYQKWCKMDPHIKETWIIAGRNLQAFAKLSNAKMQEVKKTPVTIHKFKPGDKAKVVAANDDTKSAEDDTESDLDTEEEAEYERQAAEKRKNIVNKNDERKSVAVVTPTISIMLNDSVVITPTEKKTCPIIVDEKTCRLALRFDRERNVIEEQTIEKILAKRFNPKKKNHEYLVKWLGFDQTRNTWEPAMHMDKSKVVLEAFEWSLAKQKQQKAAAAAVAAATPKPSSITTVKSSTQPVQRKTAAVQPTPSFSQSRPQRSSKQRALDQVKMWCGDITEDGRAKRRSEADHQSDDKRLRRDSDLSDDSETEKIGSTIGPARRQAAQTAAKTANVVPATSVFRRAVGRPPNPATLAHRAAMARKMDGQVASTSTTPTTPTTPTAAAKQAKKPAKKRASSAAHDSDSDTGLPEDDFPKDLPPVRPDSPPAEFTLCPLTGRVLGQEGQSQGEPLAVPKLESEPQPKPKPVAKPAAKPAPEAIAKPEETIMVKVEDIKAEKEEPVLLTGEDGTVYQVAGQDEQGQTLLVTQTSDGEQQCVYLAQDTEEMPVLTLDTAVAEAVSDVTTTGQALTIQTENDTQIVAEIVKAELPSPGGTRKVVLLLPNGNIMMTEMDAEQYASLELDP